MPWLQGLLFRERRIQLSIILSHSFAIAGAGHVSGVLISLACGEITGSEQGKERIYTTYTVREAEKALAPFSFFLYGSSSLLACRPDKEWAKKIYTLCAASVLEQIRILLQSPTEHDTLAGQVARLTEHRHHISTFLCCA